MPRPPSFAQTQRDDLTPLGKVLDYWLWQNRITPGQLAYKLGVSPNSVHYWMHRGTRPQLETLYRLGEVTGIPMEELFASIGIVIPTESPAPQQVRPPSFRRPGDENPWDYAIRRAETLPGYDPEFRAAMIRFLRDLAAGYDPQAERVRQEQEYGAPIEPVSESVGEPSAPEPETETTRRPHVAKPDQQERRAPRRRQTAPPRRAGR